MMTYLRYLPAAILIITIMLISGVNARNDTITIIPVDDHTTEETFFINGTTSLPPGKPLVIDVEPVRLHLAPSHEPPKNTTSLTLTTVTKPDTGMGMTTWSFLINSGSLSPDHYLIRITSFEAPIVDATVDFTIIPDNRSRPSAPDTGFGTLSNSSNMSASPTTKSSPLPFTLVFGAWGVITVTVRLFRKGSSS